MSNSTEKVTVLVTGGTGLVGRALSDETKSTSSQMNENENWVFLSSKDGDLSDLSVTQQLFEKHRPTYVIHLAAFVGGLFENMKLKAEFYMKNSRMNENIIECCHRFEVKKLISCLSTCIFPDKTTYPIDESMIHTGPPHSSNEGYAYAKRMIDIMNRAYHDQYGCMFTSIIPTNIYGPYDNFNVEKGHVIPGLIHKCKKAMETQEDFVIYGSGKPLRQFIFNRDLAKLIVIVLRKYESIDPIILSVGESEEVSIEHVARTISSAFQFSGNLTFDTSKADGQFKKTANNAKLLNLAPDFKFTSMENGLQETVEWFKQHYDEARK